MVIVAMVSKHGGRRPEVVMNVGKCERRSIVGVRVNVGGRVGLMGVLRVVSGGMIQRQWAGLGESEFLMQCGG